MPKLMLMLSILLPSFLFGKDDTLFMTYFPIKVWGDVELYRYVFNAAAMFFESHAYSSFLSIAFLFVIGRTGAQIAGLISTPGIGASAIETGLKGLLFIVAVYFLSANTAMKVPVTIEDQRTYFGTKAPDGTSKAIVDHIPWIVALPASVASTAGAILLDVVDTVANPINGVRYTDVGFLKNFDMLRKERFIRIDSSPRGIEFKSKFKHYVKDCVFKAMYTIGEPYDLKIGDGIVTLAGLAPDKFTPLTDGSNVMDVLADGRNVPCREVWDDLMQYYDAQNITSEYSDRVSKSLGFKNMAEASGLFDSMADNMYAGVDDMAKGMSPYVGLQLQASLSSAVAEAKYADSLGLTGIQANALNQNLNSAVTKSQTDGVQQANFAYLLVSMPFLINFITALTYFLFPLILLVICFRGLEAGKKVFYTYLISLGAFELYRISLAIVHGLVTTQTSKNAAAALMGTLDKGHMYHTQAYYEYMAMQANSAATLGNNLVWIVPIIIITGGAYMAFFAGRSATSAQMTDVAGAQSQILGSDLKERTHQISDNLTGKKTGLDEYYYSEQFMKDLTANNQALLEAQRYARGLEYTTRSQIGRGLQDIEKDVGFASEIKSTDDLKQIAASGGYQGVSQASQAMAMGSVMQNGVDISGTGKHVSGDSLARASGDYGAQQQIGAAKGLIASQAYNDAGMLAGTNSSNNLIRGMENQARIGLNQTMGVGKEDLSGQAGVDKMNAIEYGAHAGLKGNIAKGKALREVYGKDLEGGGTAGKSYDDIASANARVATAQEAGQGLANEKRIKETGMSGITKNTATLTDAQNIETDNKADVLQRRYKDLLNSGKGKDATHSFKEVSGANIEAKEVATIGAGEENAKLFKKGVELKDSEGNVTSTTPYDQVLQNSAAHDVASRAKGFASKFNTEGATQLSKKRESDEYKERLKEVTKDQIASIDKDSASAMHHRSQAIDEAIARSEEGEKHARLMRAHREGAAYLIAEKLEARRNQLYEKNKAVVDERANNLKEQVNQRGMEQIDKEFKPSAERILDGMSDTVATSQGMQYAQMSADITQAQGMGYISNGGLNATGMQAYNVMAANKFGSIEADRRAFGNTNTQNEIIKQLESSGMSAADIAAIRQGGSLGGAAGFRREFLARTRGVEFDTMINGKRTKATMGQDGAFQGRTMEGMSYAYDESRSFQFGTRADAGNLYYKGADAMSGGNINAMRGVAYTGAAINAVTDTAGVINSVVPGGAVFKGVINTGKISQTAAHALRRDMGGIKKTWEPKTSPNSNASSNLKGGG
ncbi:hypothetical protein BKH46_08765 [Helicobacter sp. 12S02634-8]|uniref:conjugal transfer protein TraG N-terminal domain-containing protein n=1 Tax=Helicobacter sp. 12S02634-8 TaxID=1476199 RepID=UPI000BA6A236|nr:conjugal transfer protein TraG N-terminal domain-containing protein [Helicobacter sp. 12S02634-8]PAF46160.1 hypothetical protein BKH46_08765 [Helicobacter sp. 12S02634-8]